MECLSGFQVGERLHGWSACCASLGTQVQYNTTRTHINMLTFFFIYKKEMLSSHHKKNGSKYLSLSHSSWPCHLDLRFAS